MKKGIVTLIGVAGLATAASAQTGGTFTFTSDNANGGIVNQMNPTTTIGIWATWTGALHLFAAANYDLTAGDGVFGDETNILNGPASSAGVAAGNTITGGINGQLHIPVLGPPFIGIEDNPILLATYSWTTTDFTARSVSLDTSNTINFIVALIETGATTNLIQGQFSPGSGSITVIPAPSALALLGLGGLVATRRRR